LAIPKLNPNREKLFFFYSFDETLSRIRIRLRRSAWAPRALSGMFSRARWSVWAISRIRCQHSGAGGSYDTPAVSKRRHSVVPDQFCR
jgi:hypothetical protein